MIFGLLGGDSGERHPGKHLFRQDQGIMAVAKHFAYNEQDDYR
jgi:hypothetical protein